MHSWRINLKTKNVVDEKINKPFQIPAQNTAIQQIQFYPLCKTITNLFN